MEPVSAAHEPTAGGGDAAWTWPPYGPEAPVEPGRFRIDEWAPPSTVRHPWVRVGRFTLLYRRGA